MQDLTGNPSCPANLVPSYMGGGNEAVSPHVQQAAMSGPGSLGSAVEPELVNGGANLPGPQLGNADSGAHTATPLGAPMPVNHPITKPDGEPTGEAGRLPSAITGWQGHWTAAGGSSGRWTET
jgi:hypothetical protein